VNFDAVRPNLYRLFWLGVTVLAGYAAVQGVGTPPLLMVLAAIVAAFALFPAYLWCAGRVDGLPIFPLFAMTHAWTFAMPMVMQNRPVARYAPEDQAVAALTVMLYLGVGTAAWLLALGSRRPRQAASYWGLAPKGNNWAFLSGLVLALAIFTAIRTGTLAEILNREGAENVLSVFQSAALSLLVLCSTLLSYRAGQRELNGFELTAFFSLFVLNLLIMAISLVLNQALGAVLVALGVFTISRGRIPLVVLGIAFVAFSVLHVGKWQMRDKYTRPGRRAFQLEDLPGRYEEWIRYGLEDLPDTLAGEKYSRRRHQSLVERGSLLQMLLLVQTKTPDYKEYLGGRTYRIIPGLLVPRFIDPKKMRSHEGTYMLSMHYGLQDYKATLKTTIGFGPLAEAYANFSYAGVIGVAVVLGSLYGWGTRWSLRAPVSSLRCLFALLLLASAIGVEYSAGVLVTTLFQGSVVLGALALVAMRSRATPAPRPDPALRPPRPVPMAVGGVP
jgi:hypothetical protein